MSRWPRIIMSLTLLGTAALHSMAAAAQSEHPAGESSAAARDDLSIERGGRELRSFGSQGEQRLSLLALLLAERDVLSEQRGRPPVMLLDDVMSELDLARRRLLVAALQECGQSVITTTDPDLVPGAAYPPAIRLAVYPGMVTAESGSGSCRLSLVSIRTASTAMIRWRA